MRKRAAVDDSGHLVQLAIILLSDQNLICRDQRCKAHSDTLIGITTSPMSVLMYKEKPELSNYRPGLREEDQVIFDALWTHVAKHVM